jgi:hypothetical protein
MPGIEMQNLPQSSMHTSDKETVSLEAQSDEEILSE